MAGTKEGGKRAAATNVRKYGEDFYRNIGSKGGQNSHTGGWYNDSERAARDGRKGGIKSRRAPRVDDETFISVYNKHNGDAALTAAELGYTTTSVYHRAQKLRKVAKKRRIRSLLHIFRYEEL